MLKKIDKPDFPAALWDASRDCWDSALGHGEKFGYKNSQVTVLAPTGTIGFMMDCDTTGIEPDLALVKYKKLVRSEEHTSELQSRLHLVCRLLLEKKKNKQQRLHTLKQERSASDLH